VVEEQILETECSKEALSHVLSHDFMRFNRYFFRHRLGYKFIVSPHHKILCDTLQQVIDGNIKRLIINMPPGYTKTEMAVVSFIAYGLAKNPKSKFIHATYSDALAMSNSMNVRDVVTSPEFQELWDIPLRKDSTAKGAWLTEAGGGLQARPAGGPITGFRAGQPDEGFTGAFIIDDPLKPDDAFSEPAVERINQRFNGVFRSRLMQERVTPMIIIMQRISQNDPSNFLLTGGTKEQWHHLNLAAEIDHDTPYPKEYTHGIEIDTKSLPEGALWDYKHTMSELKNLETADPHTYNAQYMQAPEAIGGSIFKDEWWQLYKAGTIDFEYRFVTADTAMKAKEHNDYSVFQCWGYSKGNIYLIDQIRDRWEAPQLKQHAIDFWTKHFGAPNGGALRFMAVEDKASGTGLIQSLQQELDIPIPVRAIQRNIDKVTRAMDAAPMVAAGRVHIPAGAEFVSEFRDEFRRFSRKDTHKHDDQVDPAMDAIDIGLRPNGDVVGVIDDVWMPSHHIVQPFQIPFGWKLDRSMTWHSVRPFSIGWWAESDGSPYTDHNGDQQTVPAGTLFRLWEWYGEKTHLSNEGLRLSPEDVAKGIKRREAYLLSIGRVQGDFTSGVADDIIVQRTNTKGVDTIQKIMSSAKVRWVGVKHTPEDELNHLQAIRQRLTSSTTGDGAGLYIMSGCTTSSMMFGVTPCDEKVIDQVSRTKTTYTFHDIRLRVAKGNNHQSTEINVQFPS
jgi:predicted phage terminase large subunit-like protein